MGSDQATQLAVRIDADTAQPGMAVGLLAEVALLTQSIQSIQQFGYTNGKNAIALFELERRGPGNSRPKVIYVRNKSHHPNAREW